MNAHAKINLMLSVGAKREDGFHPLKTVFQPLVLHDEVMVTGSKTPGVHIDCNNPAVPRDKSNTAYKAAEKMATRANKDMSVTGVRIEIIKKIPLAGGLGGSAVDAAPVITGLNQLWRARLSQAEMEALGASIGADVSSAIRSRTCYAMGKGDDIREEFSMPSIGVCIVVPKTYMNDTQSKTALLYNELDSFERSDVNENRMLAALRGRDWHAVAGLMQNDFEHVAFKYHPELAEVKEILMRYGAIGALLAGSGGTMFGLFDKPLCMSAVIGRLSTESMVKKILKTETKSD